jgi:hypothetical protein
MGYCRLMRDLVMNWGLNYEILVVWSSISVLEIIFDSLYIAIGRLATVGLNCNDYRLHNLRQNMPGSDSIAL